MEGKSLLSDMSLFDSSQAPLYGCSLVNFFARAQAILFLCSRAVSPKKSNDSDISQIIQ